MSVTAAFCPLSLQVVFDSNGVPIPGATLSFFDAGTTNPRQSFSDAALSQDQTSPVAADAYGRLPAIFLGAGAYKMVLRDQSGAQISAADGIPGGIDSGSSPTPAGTTIPTGFVMQAHTDDVFDGWLPLNGLTIGNSTSGASARANTDAQALFVTLWNKDQSLTVLGGRGLTATADWGAGKTITLPDYRKAVVVGVSGMGVAPDASGTIFTDVIGAKVGAENTTLTTDQIPALNLSGTIGSAGGHTHAGSTDANGSHSHVGTVDSAGAHTHSYLDASFTLVGSGTSQNGGFGPPGKVNQTIVAGDHTHGVTLGGGTHGHSLNIAGVGDHTHSLTIASIGAGGSHSNVQLSIQAYFHIKL